MRTWTWKCDESTVQYLREDKFLANTVVSFGLYKCLLISIKRQNVFFKNIVQRYAVLQYIQYCSHET